MKNSLKTIFCLAFGFAFLSLTPQSFAMEEGKYDEMKKIKKHHQQKEEERQKEMKKLQEEHQKKEKKHKKKEDKLKKEKNEKEMNMPAKGGLPPLAPLAMKPFP